jgi:hypothetical protein
MGRNGTGLNGRNGTGHPANGKIATVDGLGMIEYNPGVPDAPITPRVEAFLRSVVRAIRDIERREKEAGTARQ